MKPNAKPKTHLAPRDVRTHAEHLRLRRDNVSTAKSWFMLEGDGLCVANQRTGEACTGKVTLTRHEVERLIAFWTKPQRLTQYGVKRKAK